MHPGPVDVPRTVRLVEVDLPTHGCEEVMIMDTPKFYDIQNNNDALHFGLSPTEPTQNSKGVPARKFLLSRSYPGREGAQPRFIVLHIQQGTTRGSLQHWVAGTYTGEDGK